MQVTKKERAELVASKAQVEHHFTELKGDHMTTLQKPKTTSNGQCYIEMLTNE